MSVLEPKDKFIKSGFTEICWTLCVTPDLIFGAVCDLESVDLKSALYNKVSCTSAMQGHGARATENPEVEAAWESKHMGNERHGVDLVPREAGPGASTTRTELAATEGDWKHHSVVT